MINELVRTNIRSLYDAQKIRIQTGNRIVAAFRTKLGIDGQSNDENDPQTNKLLDQLRAEHKRMTDGVTKITRRFKCESPLITDYSELMLIETYNKQLEIENIHTTLLEMAVEKENIWQGFLKDIKGVGPLMAGVILSEVDIHKCNSVSALWAYAGLDVIHVKNEQGELVGEGRSTKKHHHVPKTYTKTDGTLTETTGISFNPVLKSKMVFVLADVFIKMGGKYRDIYDGYKLRLENHPKHKEKTKGHRHSMAKRYMIKQFLADLWIAWRTMEGLEVRAPYAEAKLGINHHYKDAA